MSRDDATRDVAVLHHSRRLESGMAVTPLLNRISELSDDAALEAANLLAGDILGAASDDEVAGQLSAALDSQQAEIAAAMQAASPHECAELARLALAAAAA